MRKTVSFTRSDLYGLVWSTPLLTLAKDIGVSDVALAKACRKVGIPLPGRGHWAKSEHLRQKPAMLPNFSGKGSGDVTFSVLEAGTPSLPRRNLEQIPRIAVASDLTNPHPLVALTMRASKGATLYNGRLSFAGKRVLSLSVSPDTLTRALLLLDALITSCDSRGHVWKVSSEGKTLISCGGREIEVTLHERLAKRPLPRTTRKAHYWEGGPGPFFSHQEYEWTSTNSLTFAVANSVAGGARRTWSDGKAIRLESKLHEIVAGLPAVAQGIADLEAERAARQKKREDDEANRREIARQEETRRKLREKLASYVTRSQRAEAIRAFCERLEAHCRDHGIDRCADTDAWVAWARAQADALDPITGDISELVRLDVNSPPWFSSCSSSNPVDWWKP